MMGKKRKYRVSGSIKIGVYTEVEASSKAEAVRLAQEHPVLALCHECTTGSADEGWKTSGELDEEPTDVRAEMADR